MTREKTLGQIAFETQFHPTAWLEISDFHKKAWEEQASAIRAEVIEECAKAISNDFHWVLPLYDKDRLNEVSDDAAEEVRRQIVLTLRSLKEQPE
jgi:hypothetical protein